MVLSETYQQSYHNLNRITLFAFTILFLFKFYSMREITFQNPIRIILLALLKAIHIAASLISLVSFSFIMYSPHPFSLVPSSPTSSFPATKSSHSSSL